MSKDYQGTSIGFVTDQHHPAGSPLSMKGLFASKVGLTSNSAIGFNTPSTTGKIDLSSKFSSNFLSTKLATMVLATTTAIAGITQPTLVGGLVGDFERGRAATHTKTNPCSESCNPATRLGQFVGNYEQMFEKGRAQGFDRALDERKHRQQTPGN